MYQAPVGNVETIRKARRAVKNILCEIGLEDCQKHLKELKEKSEKGEDEEVFEDTEWFNFTDGYNGRLHKKWTYRSRALCCSMCKYSSQNIYNFRSHVSRCHEYVQSFCALALCSQCSYIGNPRDLKKHMLFFHAKFTSHIQPARESIIPTHRGNERYQCRKCGYPSSSIFAMKKHIILKHLEGLTEQYIGYRLHTQGGTSTRIYCCKMCKGNTGNLDQMLHHMLVSPAHYSVSTQVQNLIHENKNYTIKPTANGNGVFLTFPNIAPKLQQPHLLNSKPLVLPSNGQHAGAVLTLQGPPNSTTLICSPGSNQAFLPPQASALVQLASAEAKGLLQPGATIALRSALPQGPSMVQIPTVSNVSLKQAPLTLAPQLQPQLQSHLQSQLQPQLQSQLQPQLQSQLQPQLQSQLQPQLQSQLQPQLQSQLQHQQQPQPQSNQLPHQILLPSGLQANMASGPETAPKPAVAAQNTSANQMSLQGTMLTSQSLLSHLIPTGNKVNGMPTYTFAPLQVAMPSPQSTSTPLKPVEQVSNSSRTKKWITCPLCNELFPSNVFEMHTEVAHQTKSSTIKTESVAARANFLKKMPDKTVKCLTCKILLSEKSVFQHLLHGLNCLSCSATFFSIKQLTEHVKVHNPSSKAYSDFLRQKYRVYTKSMGGILFPHFDVHTTGPKEVLGEHEVNLVLVTNSLDLIYFKLQPSSQPDICSAPAKINSSCCPFCDEKFHNEAKHLQHLKQKHYVAPTIHAILKTEAFKCIYCNGVYTGKVTQQAVMLHIQRCRCSPKQPQVPKPTGGTEDLPSGRGTQQPPKPPPQIPQPSGLYFLQVPQGLTIKQTLAPAKVIPAAHSASRPSVGLKETEAEMQSKKRLEAAWREVMEVNKREREEKAARRKKQVQEKQLPTPEPEPQVDPAVKLVIEPTQVERRCNDDRREFISKYFNVNPYATKAESDELCKRLSLTKGELAALFSKKRTKCMKTLKRNTATILLGFNMTELSKVKHNLLIPEQKPPEPTDDTENVSDEPQPMDESENVCPDEEQMEQTEEVQKSSEMEQSVTATE